MPYLTPETIPEDDDCRPLVIPASSDWLAIVSGALTELTLPWNWQQQGAVTVVEAIAAMQAMIDNYYGGCTACTLPGGSPLFRLNPSTGAIEELSPAGDWQAPDGAYTIPATPSRTEPTPDERICAAAANAANTLKTLYESLSDSFNSGLSYDAAVAAFVAAIVGAIGSVFGIVVTPLIIIFAILFGVVYATVEFVTADLWDSTFTDKLVCILVNRASDDGSVVHFNFSGVIDDLAHATNIFDVTTSEIRLFGQLYTILSFLGAQSLDAMGATTAIVSPDCSGCGWCRAEDFGISDYGWSTAPEFGLSATYSGSSWDTVPTFSAPNSWDAMGIEKVFASPALFTEIDLSLNNTLGTITGACPQAIQLYLAGTLVVNQVTDPSISGVNGMQWTGSQMADKIVFVLYVSNLAGTGTGRATATTCKGQGDNPFGDNNC